MQQDEVNNLKSKLNEAEIKIHKLSLENEKLSSLLQITKETQSSLAVELGQSKDQYNEVIGLLRDTQEQLRRQRRRGMPTARGGALYPSLCNTGQPDSLQSEMETSLFSELSLDSGFSTGSERM